MLPKNLDIDDIKIGRSEIRNKVIVRFFKELRFIEEWGTGIRRIITSCKGTGLKEPDFIETGMHFKVVLYKHSSGLKDYENLKLSPNEKVIINYLHSNSSITNKEAVRITSLSPAGVRKIISALQKKGLIDAMGEGRSRYYVLKKH